MHGEQRSTCRIRWFDRACGSRVLWGCLSGATSFVGMKKTSSMNIWSVVFVDDDDDVVVVVVVVVVAVSAVRRMHHSRATTFGSRRFNKALKFRFVSDFFGISYSCPMLEVLSAVTGEPIAVFEEVDFAEGSVKALKQRLAQTIGIPRFRLRLLQDNCALDDDQTLINDKKSNLQVLQPCDPGASAA